MSNSSPDLSIARALTEIIAGISPALVPTTQLAGDVAAGAVTVPLASVQGLVKGGRLDIWDAAGERSWAIDAIDPVAGTVTIRTAGLAGVGITGLQSDHLEGALVTTNLMAFEAVKIAHMFAGDLPVILTYALGDSSRVIGSKRSGPTLRCNIEVRRSIFLAEDDVLDENDFAEVQQERVRSALQTIQDTVQSNRHLLTSMGTHATDLGDGTGAPEFTKAWGQVVVKEDNEQFVGVLQLTVRGAPHTF